MGHNAAPPGSVRRLPSSSELMAGRTYRELVDGYEKSVILIALAATHGNQRRTAELLGLLPSTLNEKMRRYRIRAIDAAPRTPAV